MSTAPARPSATLSDVVGIDFGVSYTGLAVCTPTRVEVVPTGANQALTPSVVYYPASGPPLVGETARRLRPTEPARVVSSIKRLLGRFASDPLIGGFLQSASFATAVGPNDSILVAAAQEPAPVVAVCADILRHVVLVSSQQVRAPITKALLSHPVSFNEVQKKSLTLAARMAGLEVVGLIEEPVAAALAAGRGRQGAELVAVYDLGGGTFDFTLLEFNQGRHRVLVSDGDGWLGGDDFDLALADAIANSFWRRTQVELRNRAVEWQRLLLSCEQAKRTLTDHPSAPVLVENIAVASGPTELKMSLNRAALEKVCQPLVARSLEVCRRALDTAGVRPAQVHTILLCGGSSRIPFVQAAVQGLFARHIPLPVDPDLAVVRGAAVAAAMTARSR